MLSGLAESRVWNFAREQRVDPFELPPVRRHLQSPKALARLRARQDRLRLDVPSLSIMMLTCEPL